MIESKPKAADDVFSPVSFDPAAYVKQRCAADAPFKSAYEALQDEFSALDALLRARKVAGFKGR